MSEGLLDWYDRTARDLPWRRRSDPYAIWVSEIMLQQTQVRTVIPYWERWMTVLPDVRSLAAASESDVLKLWEGLGYYRRARNLQAAAKLVLERHHGVFPRAFEDVLALPGIGRYTAGAICSIAYDDPVPIVDGNVTRVLSRLFALAGDPRNPRTVARLWREAAEGVQAAARTGQHRACSRFNQALMELGATLCLPQAPVCGDCPLRDRCLARLRGRPEAYPGSTRRPGVRAREFVVFVVRSRGAWLARRRPEGEVNGGLWEFPNVEIGDRSESVLAAAMRVLGREPDGVEPLTVVRHSITRYRITQRAFRVRLSVRRRVDPRAGSWVKDEALAGLPWVTAHRRILEAARGGR